MWTWNQLRCSTKKLAWIGCFFTEKIRETEGQLSGSFTIFVRKMVEVEAQFSSPFSGPGNQASLLSFNKGGPVSGSRKWTQKWAPEIGDVFGQKLFPCGFLVAGEPRG